MTVKSKIEADTDHITIIGDRVFANPRIRLGRNENGWCIRQYDGDEIIEVRYFDSYEEMIDFGSKLLADSEETQAI